jgi:hypothetical protein
VKAVALQRWGYMAFLTLSLSKGEAGRHVESRRAICGDEPYSAAAAAGMSAVRV